MRLWCLTPLSHFIGNFKPNYGGENLLEINLDKLIQYISQVGFPIVVASFLLLRTNGKLEKLKDAITELREAIQELNLKLTNFK